MIVGNKIFNFILFALIIALFAWLGFTFYRSYQPKPTILQGQIEAKEYSISSKIAGRIDKVFVQKGDMVTKNMPIFTINSPELEAKIAQAKAQKEAASAQAQEADKGARKQQIAAAHDEWQKAKAAANLAQKTYKRIKNLYKEGVVSSQKKDEAYTRYKAAKFTQEAAFQMYEMAQEGTRKEQKIAASQKEKMAASAVEEIEAYAKDLKIRSFYNGEVSMVLLNSGELAPQGFPVVQVVDMNDSWVSIHIREDSLKRFQKGATFEAQIPALGSKKYTFKVTYISVLGSYATWRATNVQKDFDMRTFEIQAKATKPIKNLRVGMSVLVP